MKEDEDVPIILGSPILNTTRSLVDIQDSKLNLRVGKEEIAFRVHKGFETSKS